MPASDIVRAASESDLSQITEIYAHFVRHGTASFELEPPDLEEMRARWRRLTQAAYPYLVLESQARVAGYAYAGPYRPRPAYAWTAETSVYVAAWAERRGFGRALLEALLPACERRGLRQLVAIIGDSRHVASIRLHERLGFTHIGTLADVGFKHGHWLDTVIMQRAIGAGATGPPERGG